MAINPVGGNQNEPQPMKLRQIKQMDDASIFEKFDTDDDGKICDGEIISAGYVGRAFDKVAGYLIKRFGREKVLCACERNERGYFPYPSWRWGQKNIKSLDQIPMGSHNNIRDARHCNITRLNLTEEQLLNLCIDKTTEMTPEQKAILESYMEAMKNPGLGIRQLHEQGITGKGVKMAIIDQQLGLHKEYSDNIIGQVHDINSKEFGWTEASMHGAAVTSIAVGKNTGVAPEAGVVYYSAVNLTRDPEDIKLYIENLKKEIEANSGDKDYVKYLRGKISFINYAGGCNSNKPHVEAINEILDENEKLPENERVSVISISWGFDKFAPGYEELQQTIKRAKDQGVFIVSTALEDHYGMATCGANRDPKADPNDPNSYEAGAFWKDDHMQMPDEYKDKFLLFPMDHRTVADFTDDTSYRYEGNDGGISWSTPWIAGMYVLAKQVNPDITPEEFWEIALKTSNPCNNNDNGEYVGRIVNPQGIIDEIRYREEQYFTF